MHAKSCLTVCDPMDCSLPGSSVHGIFQERILESVTTPTSRGSSPPRDRAHCLLRLLHWQVGSLLLIPAEKPLWVFVIVQSLKPRPALCDHMDCSMVAFPISWSFLKLMPIVLRMTLYHLLLCHLLPPSIFPSIRVFSNVNPSHQVAKVLELQLQHHSFQWTVRTDFL